MRIDFCCKALARAILSEGMIQTSDGIFVDGDEVIYCPFCGAKVENISDEYIHEGYRDEVLLC